MNAHVNIFLEEIKLKNNCNGPLLFEPWGVEHFVLED